LQVPKAPCLLPPPLPLPPPVKRFDSVSKQETRQKKVIKTNFQTQDNAAADVDAEPVIDPTMTVKQYLEMLAESQVHQLVRSGERKMAEFAALAAAKRAELVALV
jgi:hypothetical protein